MTFSPGFNCNWLKKHSKECQNWTWQFVQSDLFSTTIVSLGATKPAIIFNCLNFFYILFCSLTVRIFRLMVYMSQNQQFSDFLETFPESSVPFTLCLKCHGAFGRMENARSLAKLKRHKTAVIVLTTKGNSPV